MEELKIKIDTSALDQLSKEVDRVGSALRAFADAMCAAEESIMMTIDDRLSLADAIRQVNTKK